MAHTATPTVIAGAELRAMRQRAFRTRESTLDSEAAPYTLADWRATIESFRRMTRVTLTDLSERAFASQPGSSETEVWSAGQIVRHLAQTQIDTFFAAIRRANTLPAPSSAELGVPDGDAPLTRAQALAALDVADRDVQRFFDDLPSDLDLTARVPSEYFDSVGAGGLLTIVAIHEEDHWGQLNELR
jgi:hypothetical protein